MAQPTCNLQRATGNWQLATGTLARRERASEMPPALQVSMEATPRCTLQRHLEGTTRQATCVCECVCACVRVCKSVCVSVGTRQFNAVKGRKEKKNKAAFRYMGYLEGINGIDIHTCI